MKLIPVGQRIIVKRLSEKERVGILVPEAVRRTSLVGLVVHKGPEAEWVNEGDIVLFAKFSGFILPSDVGYEDCLVMNCEDILSKIDNYDQAQDKKNEHDDSFQQSEFSNSTGFQKELQKAVAEVAL